MTIATSQTPQDADTADVDDLIEMVAEAIMSTDDGDAVARVISYDSTTERAKVRPVVRQVIDGVVQPPVDLEGVKVSWEGTAGTALTFPIAAGDFVELGVLADDHSVFWASGQADVAAPRPSRRRTIADVVCRPLRAPTALPADAKATDGPVLYGQVAAYLAGVIGAQLLARFDRVEAELVRMRGEDRLHTHTAPPGGGATSTPLPGQLTDPAPGSTACDRAKGV